MNNYGQMALSHWEATFPNRVAELSDPTAFFETLGLEIQAQVTNLASILAGSDRQGETFMQKVARLTAARKQAEEVVMAQLAWITDPSLPLDQAREEWEQTRPSDENLILWAERMQDSPDSMPSSTDLEEMAKTWALPVEFLLGLAATEPPREYMKANQPALAEAATIRFFRELR
ncbi:MAG: hypothetical protein AB7L91_15300 [Dehalococcoidia bacterium]